VPVKAKEDVKAKSRKEKKAQVAKDKGWFKKNVKPDLRKRTWDVVEEGVEGLDYDGSEGGNARGRGEGRPMQRRKITYDD